MGNISDAKVHLEASMRALCLEAEVLEQGKDWHQVEHFTVAEDLKRIDSAIGPKGESIFARIADSIQEAYTEIQAAHACLLKERD